MRGIALQERLATLRVPPNPDVEREIQQLVHDFVDDRKAVGWPPERVIIAVKQLAREVGLQPSQRIVRRDASTTSTDDFLVVMIGWCIHRYYHPD